MAERPGPVPENEADYSEWFSDAEAIFLPRRPLPRRIRSVEMQDTEPRSEVEEPDGQS